jgi:hypothetical protein
MTLALAPVLDLMPKGEGWATRQWGALGSVIALERAGFVREAEETLAGVVVDLQTERDRRAHLAQTRRRPGKRPKPIVQDVPTLTSANLEDVDKIETQEWLALQAFRRKDQANAKKHYDAAAAIRERIAADIVGRQDSTWSDVALRETAQLEQLRGEVVDLQQENGKVRALRIKTRDGLLALFPCRELNEEDKRRSQILRKAGLEYRAIRDATKKELGSSLPTGHVGGGNGSADPLAEKRAKALEKLKKVEAAVSADQVNGRGLTALQQIAGEGNVLGFLAKGGKGKDLFAKALRRALGVVARELKIERTQSAPYIALHACGGLTEGER